MNGTRRALAGMALPLALSACVSLPGSETNPPSRYMLNGSGDDCESGERPLSLSVVKVGVGLDTDRIARRDARSGQYTYLKDVRWIDDVDVMVEQRLAADLECRGYAVLTGHHHKLSHDQMVCEVRALNLVEDNGTDTAEVGLSCLYFKAGGREELALRAQHSRRLDNWSAADAVAATSDAYRQVLADLVEKLP